MTGNQFTIRNTQAIMSGQSNNVHINEQQADMFREILTSLDYQVYNNDDEVCDYVRRNHNYRVFETDDEVTQYVLEDEDIKEELLNEWRDEVIEEFTDEHLCFDDDEECVDYVRRNLNQRVFEDDDEIVAYVLEDEVMSEWREEYAKRIVEEYTDNHTCFEDDDEITEYVLNDASMTEVVFEGWFKKYKGGRLLFESEFDAVKYLRDTGRYYVYEEDGKPLEDPPCCLTSQALKETETKLADAEAQLTAITSEFEKLKEQNDRFFAKIQKQQKECEELALLKTIFRGLVRDDVTLELVRED